MRKSVLTLGTFDGVHRGHQALIAKVVRRARATGSKSVVLAFGMPPRHAGQSRRKPVLLTTIAEKIRLMKQRGIDHVHVLVFDRKTASTTPEDFFRDTILKRFHAREVVVGPRVAFGKNRAGKLPLLRRLGRSEGVRIDVVSMVGRGARAVSSRKIRALLEAGKVEKANALLGYPYTIEGKVIRGRQRGRHLGFPTANLDVNPVKILPRGVFWVRANGSDALCNVGIRPTFTPHAHHLHCEVFVLDRRQNFYGQKMVVSFLRRIRSEKRFASADALKKQIARDVARARLYKKAHFSI